MKKFSNYFKKQDIYWIIPYLFFKNNKIICVFFKTFYSSKLYDTLLYYNIFWPKINFQKDYFVNIKKISFFNAIFMLLIDIKISRIFFSKPDSKVFLPSSLNLNLKIFYKIKNPLDKRFFILKTYLLLINSGIFGPIFFKKQNFFYRNFANNSFFTPLISKKKKKVVYSKVYKFLSNL
jgi:hypothetical protein